MARGPAPNQPAPAASFWDELRKIPPVTRTLVLSTVAVSLPMMLQIIAPYKLVFVWDLVASGQLWRIPTSFFIGGSGFAFLFDLIMFYRNSDNLESTWYSNRSPEYAWQLLLSAIGILVINIPLRSYVHYRPLLLCITYLSSRLNPDNPVSFFGLITVKALYFPFALVGLDLLQGGIPAAAVSLTGAIIGHIWYMLEWQERGPNRPGGGRGAMVGRAPAWLARLMGSPPPSVPQPRSTDSRPYGAASAPREYTATGGHPWGRGQRLGTE